MKILLIKNDWKTNINYNTKTDFIIENISDFKTELTKRYISQKLKFNEELKDKISQSFNLVHSLIEDAKLNSFQLDKILKIILELNANTLIELIEFNNKHLLIENLFIHISILEDLGLNINDVSNSNVNVVSNKIFRKKYDYVCDEIETNSEKIINTAFVLSKNPDNIYDYINDYFDLINENYKLTKYISNSNLFLSSKFELVETNFEFSKLDKLICCKNSYEYWIYVGVIVSFKLNCFIDENVKEKYHEVSKYFS